MRVSQVPSGAGGAQALAVGHGRRAGDELVDLAGDVALQAADDLAAGLAFCPAAGDVVPGALVAGEPDHDDPPERVVGLAVAALVQPVPGDLARGRLDGAGAA